MKVIDIIQNTKRPFFSFELVPPLRGGDIHKLYESIEPLIDLAPPFINITFHRDEVEYRQAPDGSIRKITVTKRPGSVALAAAIMKRYPVEVVPHLVCGGATAHQLENDLIDLNFLDIENVMALRGDAIPGERYFTPEPGGHAHSHELVRQIKRLNQGVYLDDTLTDAVATNFCIGVAGYPEKHHEAPNPTRDIECLKEKIEAGADYVVTQMFFDNQKYFTFVERCRAQGITVPIIRRIMYDNVLYLVPPASIIARRGKIDFQIHACSPLYIAIYRRIACQHFPHALQCFIYPHRKCIKRDSNRNRWKPLHKQIIYLSQF